MTSVDATRLNLPFVGIPTYLRAPLCQDLATLDADIAILGVPSDEGSPWLPGARFAPRKMREMSVRFAGYGPVQEQNGYYDVDEDRCLLGHEIRNQRIADCGDVDIVLANPEATFRNITRSTAAILAREAIPVVLGGDHAISYGVVRAYEEPVSVVHFDAHLDYRPFVHGTEYGNGSPMIRIGELSTVERMVQVGVRSVRTSVKDLEASRGRGNEIVSVTQLRSRGIADVVAALPVGGKVYLSIDIDVLDMPLAPGCASPEPNGLSYDELRQTCFAIAARHEIVGMDVVEINPTVDTPVHSTSLLGAQIAMETMGHAVENPGYLRRKGR